MSGNALYIGDNLDVLRRYIKDESVDLVYLDPPFNSNANYNVLFAEQDGSRAASQIKAFHDTWHWDQRYTRDTQGHASRPIAILWARMKARAQPLRPRRDRQALIGERSRNARFLPKEWSDIVSY